MNLTCNQCQSKNPENSNYCNTCGHKLDTSTSEVVSGEQNTARLVKAFENEVTSISDKAKYDILISAQEKFSTWIRYQYLVITGATGIVIAILGYLGFNGIDLFGTLDKESDKLQDIIKQVSKAETSISKKLEELNNIETSKIDTYQKNLVKQINSTKELRKDLNKQINKIHKIERSKYKILVHYNTSELDHNYNKNIDSLRNKLYEQGFILKPGNIFNVTTDRQEIIYYQKSKDITEIIKLMTHSLPDNYSKIASRHEGQTDNDPMQIVIKLCKGSVGKNFNCS